jgi:hypothetical protein
MDVALLELQKHPLGNSKGDANLLNYSIKKIQMTKKLAHSLSYLNA